MNIEPRCTVCGASRLDGNGAIVELNGHPQCELCKEGALGLVADEPDLWEFGPDGRLRWIGAKPLSTFRFSETTRTNYPEVLAMNNDDERDHAEDAANQAEMATADDDMITYSLAEIRDGTGWPKDARFALLPDVEGTALLTDDITNWSAEERG